MSRDRLGIALGGGGVRGAAHVGVLQELNRSGIKIDSIAGVSAGAIIASMYAYSLDAKWIEMKFREVWSSHIVSHKLKKYFVKNISDKAFSSRIISSFNHLSILFISIFKNYMFDSSYLVQLLEELIPESSFEKMRIPLKIIATDLTTGSDLIYDTGNIKDAIVKSCAIPGVFKVINDNDSLLADGGVGMPIPIEPLRDGCNFVIGVDIGVYQFTKLKNPNISELKTRANIITSNRLKKSLHQKANYIISPNTMGCHWSSFEKAEELFQSGKVAVSENIQSLKEKIDISKIN